MTWQLDDLQRPVFHISMAVALVFAFAGPGMATAQQTVYVGGSGKTPVEVNMEVVGRLIAPSRARVVLDPPGRAMHSVFLLGTPSVAAVAPRLSPPLPEPKAPEPAPAPEPVATPEPAPAPEPVATPEPAPAPEPVATPEPEPTVALLTPQAAPAPGEILSIPFAGGASELPGGAEGDLRAIAEQLAGRDILRAQVKAYADGTTGSASSARRLSLARALAVRSILIKLGVRSTRIDVRALGDRNEGGPPDRVDVLVINR